MTFTLLGLTDAVSTCDCCGKRNLKVAVEMENEAGEVVHYGRDCAGAALYGRKDRKNGERAALLAKLAQEARALLEIARPLIAQGLDYQAVTKALGGRGSVVFGLACDTGNKLPLRIYVQGWSPAVITLPASEY